MSDPTIILAVTSISAIGVGILGKILYTLRHHVRNFCGVEFRTPSSQSRNSPRVSTTEINQIRNELSKNITPVILNPDTHIQNLEKQIKIKELENRLRRFDVITENDIIEVYGHNDENRVVI